MVQMLNETKMSAQSAAQNGKSLISPQKPAPGSRYGTNQKSQQYLGYEDLNGRSMKPANSQSAAKLSTQPRGQNMLNTPQKANGMSKMMSPMPNG